MDWIIIRCRWKECFPRSEDLDSELDSTLLKDNGEDVKVVQELLRHSSTKMTLDVYAQALTPTKRAAQPKVVRMIRENLGVPPQSVPREVGTSA